MSFQHTHPSKSQNPQPSWSPSPLASRPFPAQEPHRLPTQEEPENQAFEQDKFEATGLQLKEKYGTITPVEQARLGMLQAKMDSFKTQRIERARSQPSVLEILIRNAQSTQSTEPAAPVQPQRTIGQPDEQSEQEVDRADEQGMKLSAPPQADLPPTVQTSVQQPTPAGRSSAGVSCPDWFSHAPQRRPWTNPFQAKVTIGQPNDPYEQEADRVAEQVMSMVPPATPNVQRQADDEEQEKIQTKPLAETITPLIQRQELSEDEAPIQAKCEACEQEEQVQRSSEAVSQAQPDLESRVNASKGGGSALPEEVRSFMEPRFGADFSQVRVHTGSEALQMNRELSAQAFTHKQDIYFGAGKAPRKDALTAHELTHVVQQNGGQIKSVLQCKEENNAALAEIQGLPMYELLPRLQALPSEVRTDEEAGEFVGGPRLVIAIRAVKTKFDKGLIDFLNINKKGLESLPSDQFADILRYLGTADNSSPDHSGDALEVSNTGSEKQLTQLNLELATEIAKAAADLAGIADPTPISDGISASISLAQGDYTSASLSVIAMVPYIGDVVGKPLKLARNAAKIAKLEKEISVLTKAASKVGKKASQEIVDAGVKVVEKAVSESASKAPKIAKAEKLLNALKNFSGKAFRFGSETFRLDKKGMKHILERHHPDFWDGSEKAAQTFFDRKMSIDDIADAIEKVLQQNRETLIKKGSRGMYQVEGVYGDVAYVVGVNRGRIGQFYPK